MATFLQWEAFLIKPTKLIINRQRASDNRKYKGKLPEQPTISIHTGGEIDYAYAVKLTGDWILQQNYDVSPCGGAHIWIESTPTSELEITHRKPLSESHTANEVDADGEVDGNQGLDTDEPLTDAPKRSLLDFF